MTTSASSSNPNSSMSTSIHANVIPSEVGWQFVPQYYTFVNKQPHRLHCFYTKNSTFIHGTEGEDGRPCYGQQEIHNKILSIGFQDCKVFIHSVDAQSSANGGIIIQVIGEMSNRGEPWRKFAQTFFLAEQPNGYFVLNDIFRFLKEESVDAEDEEELSEHAEAPADIAQVPTEELAAPTAQAAHPTLASAPFDAALQDHLQPLPVAPAKPATPEIAAPEPEPVPSPHTSRKSQRPTGSTPPYPRHPHPHPRPRPSSSQNPCLHPHPFWSPRPPSLSLRNPRPRTRPRAPTPPPPPQPAASPAPPPAPAAPAPVPAPPPAAAAAPPAAAPAPKPAAVAAPAPAPSPKPTAPPAPKTWANLAAANPQKWGPQVAQEARGVSAAPLPPPVPKVEPKPEVQRPASVADKEREGGRELHPAHQAALSVATPQCFVKSVTEVISHQALSGTLTTRFGPIKELEIVRTKACAFLEFTTLDAARRAIVASLPVQLGGEGGVRIELEGGGSARISVETRKERGERPPPRPRTGGPGQERGGGAGGGGFRGASRGRGTGRGAAPAGNKS
ncbi:hypothetical protein K439DRAFT_1652464 [Ramaria rubella]|nr:hypothetical protein K439DRAFT_1652464 [Ramaria rubella]